MGYNSDFNGSYHPSKKIPLEVVERINGMDLDLKVALPTQSFYDEGDIVPWSSEMHGYNFAEDLVKIVNILKPLGIKLSGEVYRTGEESGDYELIEARGGRVYTRSGRVVYGKRKEVK